LGNFITLEEVFSGNHKLLSQAFHPMTVRFFILQAHYRGPLDFSDQALVAAGTGLKRLFRGYDQLQKIKTDAKALPAELMEKAEQRIYKALCDDLNTPIALAELFQVVSWIHTAAQSGKAIALLIKKQLHACTNV